MSHTAAGQPRRQKWYNANIFPLIPVIETRKSDQRNTSSFCFRWLIFTFWTRDSFDFEIGITASTHWGIGLIFLFPYLRGVICIPCPEKIGIFINRKLSRNSKIYNQ